MLETLLAPGRGGARDENHNKSDVTQPCGFRWFLIHLPINYAASLSLMKSYTLTSWKEVIGLQRNQLTIRKRSHPDSQAVIEMTT
ncbi:hypothetical protein ILYODFUR_006180 [Ilyodon furcidens]|uniref:Uncharacterized protein n=1 Tax=Ilyodon furcidens TaxID=33524 RepID=A0ABV0U345_9TELE